MKRKDLYMHSTEVEVIKTIGDIQGYLVRMGANQIMTQFEKGEPSGLFFTIIVDGKNVPFRLPARVEPIYKILRSGRSSRSQSADMAQAKRTAWRQIYRWIQAQLALIETGMVEAAEVLFPYRQIAPNQTIYEAVASGKFQNMLPAANELTES